MTQKKIIILFTLILGGVMVFFSLNHTNNEGNEMKKNIRDEQERMAVFLFNHYEDIEKIDFTSFEQNQSTRSWTANATVNDKVYVTFSIQALGGDSKIGFGQHVKQSQGNYLNEKEKPTDAKHIEYIDIIYWGN